jgi:hypothetical protein
VRRLFLLAVLAAAVPWADARPLKGSGPKALAVGYGAAWVGFGDGTVVRIDAGTLRRRFQRLGGGYSIPSLATGFASVWVASNGPALYRLHPRTARVTARRIWRDGGGSAPADVAIGAGAVWVADYRRNAIFRFDPTTKSVVGRTLVRHTLRGVVASRGAVWVKTIPGRGPDTGPRGTRIVSRLDPATLRLRYAFRVPCDASLQPVVTSVWVIDHCEGTLRRFDAGAGAMGPPVATGVGGSLASGFGSVWAAGGSSVLRVDPFRGSVLARIRVEANSVAAGAGFVWVMDRWEPAGGWLRRIDPATNRLVGRAIRLSPRR